MPVNIPAKVLLNAPKNYANLITNSEAMGSHTVDPSITVTSNNVVAPDGTLTADRLVETGANAGRVIQAISPTTWVINLTYTISIFARQGPGSARYITWSGGGLAAGEAPVYDINSALGGGAIDVGATATRMKRAGMYPVYTPNGDKWWRCWAVVTPSSTTGIFFAFQASATDNTSAVYTGDGTSGVFAWGWQLNNGVDLLPYAPTTTVARF